MQFGVGSSQFGIGLAGGRSLRDAFAAQVIYCRDRLGIDPVKLKVNDGAISVGHP
ncbi:hypothetical protein IVB22_31450 [Bradyrhizobium sp. 190]|nr:hypothetical protein [Bradyrhizobium sp. 190]